jgi:hypothetical protein
MKIFFNRNRNLLLPLVASVVFLLAWVYLFNGLMYDDSYIAFRYSHNWAAGHGPVWNIGEDPVEGFSSFAWVLIAAILEIIGLLPDFIMRWVGVLTWVVSMTLLVPRLVDMVSGEQTDRFAKITKGLAILSLIANAAIGFQAFHGLETALFSFAILLFVYQALRSRSLRDYLWLSAASLLLFSIRPDGAAIILPVWGILFLFDSHARKNVFLGGLTMIALIAAYTAAKWAYFGYPFPNTFYIKEATEQLAGKSYVIDYVTVLAPLLVFLVYAAGRVGLVRALTDKAFMLLITPAALFTAAYVGIDPILGNIYRFLIPTLPLFILAGLRMYSLANGQRAETPEMEKPRVAFASEAFWFFALALVTVNALFNVKVYLNYPFLQNYLGVSDETRQLRGRQLEAANRLSPAPLLATGDVGALPYFSDLPTLDIIGLSDETVAHEGLTHAYLAARQPDLLILQDFYFTGSDLILMCGPQGYDNPALDINGKSVSLNMARYTKVLDEPAIAHNGKGSTYQVVTMPGFAEDYAYIMYWDFGGDRYHLFVRRAYPQFEALVKILEEEQ